MTSRGPLQPQLPCDSMTSCLTGHFAVVCMSLSRLKVLRGYLVPTQSLGQRLILYVGQEVVTSMMDLAFHFPSFTEI